MRSCLGCALVLSVFVAGRADACTGVYVGRKASASGGTLLCRTVDTPPTTRLFRNVVRPRVENAPGRVCRGFHGFSWPLPATTYKYVCTPAAESNRFGDFAHLRTWYAHRRLAPEGTVGAYARELDLPQFFAPAHPVAADEVFELMRSRNEGTEWDPDVTRRRDVRIIGTEMQCTCHVIEVRDDVPAPMACTAWFCLGAAEHSVFLPVSALVTATDPDFARDSRPGATNAWDAAMASAHFRRLAAFAEQDRVFYGRGVRDYWRACEKALLAAEPSVRAEAVRLYREDPVRAADDLTRRACDIQQAALADAKTIFDDLAWYVTRQNSTCRYSHNYHTHVLTPFKPQKPFAVAAGRLVEFLEEK